ncbi:MAG: hypothetical protein KJP09_11480 [Bacteroidia bacterium]|nr:hypothetical protein [Bacteroidia bacterium]MBT8311048.1 hypothetical protein [Bacteroidia bacterium]NND12047.1 hypothetical protein [Flavobacteriaceae bacterium]NNK28566.1 hypothetical protein [Flavobacteriaceae bacterium]NNL61898.1 hypothetical protein [Flavobacteriaceae bacterium]
MLRQSILLFALFVLNTNANAELKYDPYPDYLDIEIEKLELEFDLFGFKSTCDFVSIESIEVYELEEEVELNIEYQRALLEELDAFESQDAVILSYQDQIELDGFLNLIASSDNLSMTTNYLSEQIKTLELEADIFGFTEKLDPISIANLEVYEIEEEVKLDFDTGKYLPEGFNVNKSVHDLDWDTIEFYELDEDIDLGIETIDYLPSDFNPYEGMVQSCDEIHF